MNNELKGVNINWEVMGAMLAALSDEEQVPFFKGFAKEMNKYPTRHQRDMQLVYISDKFTEDEQEVYAYMGERVSQ